MSKKKKKRRIKWGNLLILLVSFGLVIGLFGWGCTKLYFRFFPTMQMQIEKAWEETDMDKETKELVEAITKDDPYSEAALKIIKNYDYYTEEILNYGITDTDRLAFVADYPDKKGTDYNGSLSEEDIKDDVPKLVQWDTRWGYQKYGDDVLAITGCAPTCMAMILYYYLHDKDITPAVIANDALALDLYEQGAGTSWSLFGVVSDNVGIGCYEDDNVTAENLRKLLKSGNKIIMSMNPGDFTATGHFIVLAGLNDDGTVNVHDPNSKKRTEKSWSADTLAEQARAMFVFSEN